MTALEFYFDDRRVVPAASAAKRGEHAVSIPAIVSAKIALHNEMVQSSKKRTALARELHLVPSGVDRLLDIRHATKLETIEQALATFGRRLCCTLSDVLSRPTQVKLLTCSSPCK